MADKDVKHRKIKIGIIYFVAVVIMMVGINRLVRAGTNKEVLYSEFKQMVKEKRVENVKMNTSSGQLQFYLKEDAVLTYYTIPTESMSAITEFIEENGIAVYS